jgi:hypothetical protein
VATSEPMITFIYIVRSMRRGKRPNRIFFWDKDEWTRNGLKYAIENGLVHVELVDSNTRVTLTEKGEAQAVAMILRGEL